eukprot:gnl/TRDRNA2_/TRDRNA2_45315_c0_seq1.p1 gnl/TRDRNA2_/TRDRNA2_45315_c0~~gnl/TRDRNA2_/TRDRNA2_45315_c0_seq1.p1  ORF type:complete len:615 (+),score=89.24 gnl/TRDRNA2_/TRDRNA2_45315_c0_seq1:56-1900(+)
MHWHMPHSAVVFLAAYAAQAPVAATPCAVNKSQDALFGRSLNVSPRQHAHLDDSMLGKLAHLAISGRASSLAPAFARLHSPSSPPAASSFFHQFYRRRTPDDTASLRTDRLQVRRQAISNDNKQMETVDASSSATVRVPTDWAKALGVQDDSFKIEGNTVICVGLDIKGAVQDARRNRTFRGDGIQQEKWGILDSLAELERLCDTAGLTVIGNDYQMVQEPNAKYLIGTGKMQEIAKKVQFLGAETVVFDEELSPAQQRNLQDAIGAKVLDRTMLILKIFEQRAQTHEAKLQVALAQMQYMLPRLKTFMTTGAGMDAKGGSSGGGKFLKGIGESQLEADQRYYRKKISSIQAQLDRVRAARTLHREARKKRGHMPLVALVGYTNAGKSSMLNKLCARSDCTQAAYADDLLFATLDPTMRRLRLPGGREVLVADTVGFIQKLPTKLIPAFRSTLEVCQDADIILHVVDWSSPHSLQQSWSVLELLDEEGLNETPQILALNKADAVMSSGGPIPPVGLWLDSHEHIRPRYAVDLSATTGHNVQNLLAAIEVVLASLSVKVDCILPYSASNLRALIHKVGTIISEEYMDVGCNISALVPRSLANRLGSVEPQSVENF